MPNINLEDVHKYRTLYTAAHLYLADPINDLQNNPTLMHITGWQDQTIEEGVITFLNLSHLLIKAIEDSRQINSTRDVQGTKLTFQALMELVIALMDHKAKATIENPEHGEVSPVVEIYLEEALKITSSLARGNLPTTLGSYIIFKSAFNVDGIRKKIADSKNADERTLLKAIKTLFIQANECLVKVPEKRIEVTGVNPSAASKPKAHPQPTTKSNPNAPALTQKQAEVKTLREALQTAWTTQIGQRRETLSLEGDQGRKGLHDRISFLIDAYAGDPDKNPNSPITKDVIESFIALINTPTPQGEEQAFNDARQKALDKQLMKDFNQLATDLLAAHDNTTPETTLTRDHLLKLQSKYQKHYHVHVKRRTALVAIIAAALTALVVVVAVCFPHVAIIGGGLGAAKIAAIGTTGAIGLVASTASFFTGRSKQRFLDSVKGSDYNQAGENVYKTLLADK